MDLEFHQLDLRYEGLRVRRRERERRLLGSLAERGQQIPIVVVRIPEAPNRFVVIDGFKRIRALKRLGQDIVAATVWDMTEAEALVMNRCLRAAEGETALEQGWLLAELHRGFGLGLEDLARQFDRSTSWVSRRLGLVEQLPASIQERVRRGEIPSQAAMKSLVPMARTSPGACERLARAAAEHKFSSSEIAELYAAWRDGGPVVRQRLLEDPTLFLRARHEMEQPAEPRRPTDDLVRDLEVVGVLARRAWRNWQCAAESLESGERDQIQRCLQQALFDLNRLSQRMEKENTIVKSEPKDRDSGASPQGSTEAADCPHHGYLPPGGQEGDPFRIRANSPDGPAGEGRAVPRADSGTVCQLPWQSGAGP